MINLEWYKKVYGDEEIKMEGRTIIIPKWLIMALLNKVGLASSKKRIVRKVLKREVIKAIRRGVASMKEELHD